MFECKCERCKEELLTDTFKYGVICTRCKKGICTFVSKQCSGCGVEMGFEAWKSLNRKIDKIGEILLSVSKLVFPVLPRIIGKRRTICKSFGREFIGLQDGENSIFRIQLQKAWGIGAACQSLYTTYRVKKECEILATQMLSQCAKNCMNCMFDVFLQGVRMWRLWSISWGN